ncbi:MAG: hypothetical protein O2931_11545 [Planctomycetota bacterium]|nr:hypothetical protein [Planctomycetota bacterium]MDA1179419.1 hypothetical protein [Planctomycetota bacterium]
MARDESDRDDVFQEATALVIRAECRLPGVQSEITIGFRRTGAASFYFHPDWVWHFDPQGSIRRGYDHGILLKAEQGRLVMLKRERFPDHVDLVSREATSEESANRMAQLSHDMEHLAKGVRGRQLQIVRGLPDKSIFMTELENWFAKVAIPFRIANSLRT